MFFISTLSPKIIQSASLSGEACSNVVVVVVVVALPVLASLPVFISCCSWLLLFLVIMFLFLAFRLFDFLLSLLSRSPPLFVSGFVFFFTGD